MRVVGFVGPSGTGKSYRSMWVAKENGLNYIIDDGLLISHHKIVAGTSAKKEKTKVASVKRALFIDEVHRKSVANAIKENEPKGLLILGTSVKMVEKIASRLEVEQINQIIFINDVATKEEIALARRMRVGEGKHVIPVPTFEIKQAFSGYFIDPLRIFKRKNDKTYTADKSIVRPAYSYMGEFKIYDSALCQMCTYIVEKCDGVKKVNRVTVKSRSDGVEFNIDITGYYGRNLMEIAKGIKNEIKDPIEKYTSINVVKTHVNVSKIYIK